MHAEKNIFKCAIDWGKPCRSLPADMCVRVCVYKDVQSLNVRQCFLFSRPRAGLASLPRFLILETWSKIYRNLTRRFENMKDIPTWAESDNRTCCWDFPSHSWAQAERWLAYGCLGHLNRLSRQFDGGETGSGCWWRGGGFRSQRRKIWWWVKMCGGAWWPQRMNRTTAQSKSCFSYTPVSVCVLNQQVINCNSSGQE